MKTQTISRILVLLGPALLAACSSSGDSPAASTPVAPTRPSLFPVADARAASTAADALSHVRDVVATGRATRLGFSGPEDLDGATLGPAIPVYFVDGAKVLARTPGADPHDLMGQPVEMLYPVLVHGVVQSEILLGRDGSGTWQIFAIGGAEIARPMDQAIRSLARGGQAPPVALVEMHDIEVKLLAHEETGAVTFTAFTEQTSGGLPVGDSVPAEAALGKIAALTQRTVKHGPMDSCSGKPGEP